MDFKEFLEISDMGEVSSAILWDPLKAVMSGQLISISSHLKRIKGQKLIGLQANFKAERKT